MNYLEIFYKRSMSKSQNILYLCVLKLVLGFHDITNNIDSFVMKQIF